MAEFTLTGSDRSRDIDLGDSQTLTVTSLAGASVNIYIDRKSNGSYTSAVKGSAGYASPFTLGKGNSKVVRKSDLESEHVRVGIDGDGAKVKFAY